MGRNGVRIPIFLQQPCSMTNVRYQEPVKPVRPSEFEPAAAPKKRKAGAINTPHSVDTCRKALNGGKKPFKHFDHNVQELMIQTLQKTRVGSKPTKPPTELQMGTYARNLKDAVHYCPVPGEFQDLNDIKTALEFYQNENATSENVKRYISPMVKSLEQDLGCM